MKKYQVLKWTAEVREKELQHWQPEIGDVYFYVAVDEGKNKGVIHSETLFNKNDIKFLLLKKAGKYYKSYFEAEKHLKQDYEYLTGE